MIELEVSRFVSLQERGQNFLFPGQLSVLTFISVSVLPYPRVTAVARKKKRGGGGERGQSAKRAGGRLQLNTHAPYVVGYAWWHSTYRYSQHPYQYIQQAAYPSYCLSPDTALFMCLHNVCLYSVFLIQSCLSVCTYSTCVLSLHKANSAPPLTQEHRAVHGLRTKHLHIAFFCCFFFFFPVLFFLS